MRFLHLRLLAKMYTNIYIKDMKQGIYKTKGVFTILSLG